MKRFVLIVAVMFVAVADAATHRQMIPVHRQTAGTWQEIPGTEGDQFALVVGIRQIGAYSVSGDYYRPIATAGWGAKRTPPVPFRLPVRVERPAFAPQRQVFFQPTYYSGGFGAACVGGS